MKPSLTDVLPLLNANCGDVLKAALLHEFFPSLPKINPMWLKAPTGEVEAAFAALKSSKSAETRADAILAEVRADHAKIEDRQVPRVVDPQVAKLVLDNSTAKTLAEMPTAIRFSDVDITDVAKPSKLAIEATQTITAEAAAKKFGYSYVGLLNRLRMAGVEGERLPGQGRTKHYPLKQVEAACGAKGKHAR